MGARLVSQALSPQWAELSDTARLVLVAMCHTALDRATERQPAGQYFAGHDWLILILTGEDPGLQPYRGSAPHMAAQRRVKRAVKELVVAGAVELVQPACRGRHAVYQVAHGPQLTLLQGGA